MKNGLRQFAIASALGLSTSMAFAFPIAPTQDYTGVFFRNSEVIVNKEGGDPTKVEEGDIFWGVFSMNNLVDSNDLSGQVGPDFWTPGTTNPQEITGYFATVVDTIVPGVGGAPDRIEFAPTADPNGKLVGNEVLQFYVANAVNFDDSTQGSALATATDGTPSLSFGIVEATDYWYSFAPVDIPAAGDVGESFGGLTVIDNDGLAFTDINDPNENVVDSLVDFFFNSEIFRLTSNPGLTIGDDQAMHFGSNDPGVFQANAIPEPGTLAIVSLGLLGLGGLQRRARKS